MGQARLAIPPGVRWRQPPGRLTPPRVVTRPALRPPADLGRPPHRERPRSTAHRCGRAESRARRHWNRPAAPCPTRQAGIGHHDLGVHAPGHVVRLERVGPLALAGQELPVGPPGRPGRRLAGCSPRAQPRRRPAARPRTATAAARPAAGSLATPFLDWIRNTGKQRTGQDAYGTD